MSSKRRHSENEEQSSNDKHSFKRKSSRVHNQKKPEFRLHIGNLAEGVKKRHLEHIFKRFGKFKEVWMSSTWPCYGFAVFCDENKATVALEANNMMLLYGQRISVTVAKPRSFGKKRPKFNPHLRCYGCGVLGHVFRHCPEKYSHKNRKYTHKRHYHQNSRRSRDYHRCRRSYEAQHSSQSKWRNH